MPSIYRAIPFLFFLLLAGASSFGQTFPVQVTAQLSAPYSLTLSDYTTATSDRIVFNVFADVSRPDLQVKFVLKIEGQNVLIQTKPSFLPPPINLQGGIAERFTGFDLAAYFDPTNLDFQGITRQQFQRTGMLPEGLYRFQLEVYEYNRGVKISNTGTATGWLVLNDPPIVNLPRNNEKLQVQELQNVVLQWTPRHTGSPNSAFTTEYEVSMVEVWPATRNPNDAILTSPPILETTTNSTTFVYGPAETPLEPGRRYAFRIKAKSISGVEEINLFKNNGYSEVISFVYGDACDLPTGLKAEAISSSRIGLQWQPLINHTAYTVRYRPQSSASSPWYENSLQFNTTEITSLKPNTRYEYQLAATCGTYNSAYTTVATVTTKEAPTVDYSCGLPITPYNLDPAELIPILKVGDVIQAGDFDVVLASVSGSNGRFSGEGVIEVPYFNKAKVKTSFTNITVNKELRMVTGHMNVTGAGVEVIPQGVLDLMDDLSEGLDLLDTALAIVENNLPDYFDPTAFVADTLITVGGVITEVYNDGNGGIVIVANGKETRIPEGTPTAIADAAGNGYLVDSKGTIHKTDADTAKRAGGREYNLSVIFTAADNAKYGFDLPAEALAQAGELKEYYEKINNTYDVAWKALVVGQPDAVLANIEAAAGIDASKIQYELGGLPLMPNTPMPNAQLLSPVGKSEGTEESLLALYTPTDTTKKQQVLGQLNLVSYNAIEKTLVIVPVNGNTYNGTEQSLRTSLNSIYGQAAVNWSVSIATSITVEGIDPFDDGESGLLTNYTPSMKQVINAYKDNLNDGIYYIFLVSNPKNKQDLQGYMPRSKEVGFVFTDNHSTEEELIHTIAHELAHGAFNLQHTFSELPSMKKYTTNNLMDYNKGTKLYKYQWDKIRCPDIVVGLFESDEDGAYYSAARMIQFLKSLKANNENYAAKSDPGNQAYLKGNIVTEQDLKDQKVIDYFSNLSIYKFSSQYDAKDPIILSWLSMISENKEGVWTKLIQEKPDPIPYDQNPIILAKEMDIETDTKEKFTLSMNGYSLSDKSITLYAHQTTEGNNVKLTFFNGLIHPSGKTNSGDEKNTTNIRKAFDITIHSKNADDFKNYIRLRGAISFTDENPDSEEIIIDVVRKRSNNYITISELSIRGTDIKGGAFELGKGTGDESKATCTDYKADCYECKRVPAGEFAFNISTETTQQGQHKYKTLRLLNTKVNGSQRDGILIHMGDALSWTQGCILAMYDNEIEEIIQDDNKISSRLMGYGTKIDEKNAGRVFILSLIEFIEEKEKRMGKSLTKRVVIKDDKDEQALTVSTSDFDLMQRANRYYYSNKLYDKAVEQFALFASGLLEKVIQNKLQTKLAEYTTKLIPTLNKETYKASEVKILFETKLVELYANQAGAVTLDALQNESVAKIKEFRGYLKTSFAIFIAEKDVLEVLFDDRLTTLLHNNVVKSSIIENDKDVFKNFVTKKFTQSLYDKTLNDTKAKLIEIEMAKIEAAIAK